MTIDEVIDTFLEGRRLKEPIPGKLEKVKSYIQRSVPFGAFADNPDFDDHDMYGHRTMGVKADPHGETGAAYMDTLRGRMTAGMLRGTNNTQPQQFGNTKEVSKNVRRWNKAVWRKALKSGQINKDGSRGQFFKPRPQD